VHRGYGDAQKTADYLESFSIFLRENKDRIPALLLVMQRPRELTRKQLRELRLLLDEQGFSEANLKTAWREITNQDIAASIIGFIRNAATGSPLLSHEERVQRAMRRILASRQWTVPQRQWLERIGRQLERESIVDKEALDRGAFERDGGFSRLNRIFDGQLETVLGDIAEAMWDDAA
jgi:type I restriction enzyme R subunit